MNEPTICTPGPSARDVSECLAIAAAEFQYWQKAPGDVGTSGTGAAANILCAINGFRAPWHPKPCPSPDNETLQGILASQKVAMSEAKPLIEDLVKLANAAHAVLASADGTGCSPDLQVVTTKALEALRAALK